MASFAHKKILSTFVFFFSLLGATPSLLGDHWDWKAIDTHQLSFPKGFFWGSGVSEYQVSGAQHCPSSQWAEWEEKGNPYIRNGDRSHSAADQWNLYQTDVSLMKEFGLNAFRFSIEWSRIEPEAGVLDESAIEHYKDFIRALLAQNIAPMVTLHHFTNPIWFENLGGFEKEENIAYFVRYAKKLFQVFGGDVPYWCTINEPSAYILMGYILGGFPPGKSDFGLAATVLKNLLTAHVETYQALKEMPHGATAQIGIVHSHLKFEPKTSSNPVVAGYCHYLTANFHESVMQFFRNGIFDFTFPYQSSLQFSMPQAVNSYDFFGLNYYSRAVIDTLPDNTLVPSCFDGELMTDMPYAMYPEGFYEALLETASLGKPIIVTENGIADAKDDRRALFIERYLYALSQAIEKGCDVRGYFYWSFVDNFEWAEGWKMKFGLFALDPETKTRTLREGSKAYQKIIEGAASKN